MKTRIFFINLILIAQSVTAMKRPELPKLPVLRPYTVAQLVNDLRREDNLEEIMYAEPKNPDVSVINLDDRGLTDLTGISLLLPDDSEYPVWRISARNNHITTIPTDDLAQYKELETLELDNNCITDLGDKSNPISFAKTCPKCSWLTLSNNQIPRIYATSFAGLRSLEYLSLKKNKIHTIENGAFRALLKLEILYLDKNALREFPNHLIQGLHQLEKLTLFDNHLSSKINIEVPSRTKLEFEPQTEYPTLDLATIRKLQAAIIEDKTPSEMVQSMLNMDQDNRKLLFSRAPAHIQEKMKQAQKLATLINIINSAENPLSLKKSVQNCTNQEQDLIFETAPDEVKVKFFVILAELKRLGEQ